MAEYIRKDNITLSYSGLAEIGPYDFVGVAKYFANQILSIPAADVEPVRHGRWEILRPGKWTATFKCSECGRHITVYPRNGDPSKEYPYCHCGAKMEGGGA